MGAKLTYSTVVNVQYSTLHDDVQYCSSTVPVLINYSSRFHDADLYGMYVCCFWGGIFFEGGGVYNCTDNPKNTLDSIEYSNTL